MADWNERLTDAVRAGSAKRVREALSRGASPRGANGKSAATTAGAPTPLHLAAERGDPEVLRTLLESPGARRSLKSADSQGRTPLHCAVQAGRIDAARALLDAGANANAPDLFGNTAIRAAAADGTLEMVKLLLAAGADPLVPGRLTLNAVDRARQRRTPEGRMITVYLERWLADGNRPASTTTGRTKRRRRTRVRRRQRP